VGEQTRRQRKPSATADRDGAPPIVQQVLTSEGQPLDAETRAFVEPRFGHDFSQVRVHTDGRAAESAEAVNAHAYTVGRDIVFDAGQYAPGTSEGQKLIAHELAHVVQQSRGGRPPSLALPGSALERSADQAASAFMRGSGPVHVAGASGPGLARQPRSLNESLNPQALSDAELEREIQLIQQWLIEHQESSAEQDQLTRTLQALEDAMRARRPEESSRGRPAARQERVQEGEGFANPLISAGGFAWGLYTGLNQTLSAEQLAQLGLGAGATSLLNIVFPWPFLAGAAESISTNIYETVRGIPELVEHIDELIAAAVELVKALISEESASIAYKIGEEIGRSFGRDIVEVVEGNPLFFPYRLGKLVGPTVVSIVLSVLGIPALAGAALAARLSVLLRPLLQRMPRLARLVRRLGRRTRSVEVPESDVPIEPTLTPADQPHTRRQAQFGDIAPHNRQGRAIRQNGISGKRLSEHEHIRARINVFIQTLDPQSSTSPYSTRAYRRSATLTIPYDMAREKTRMDLQLRDRLREAQRTGIVTRELEQEMTIEADIERAMLARQRAIEARRAAGNNDITDLEAITDEKIMEAAHLQHGELFDVGRSQRSPITDASEEEIDTAINQLDAE
jgi:hypothetical protein